MKTVEKEEFEIKTGVAKKPKIQTVETTTESIDYGSEIDKLATTGTSRLNIYCIRPERINSESVDSIELTGKINI